MPLCFGLRAVSAIELIYGTVLSTCLILHCQKLSTELVVGSKTSLPLTIHGEDGEAYCSCSVQECVVYDGEGYVVVHKPAGVQVAPTVDNVLENVLFCTAQVCLSVTLHQKLYLVFGTQNITLSNSP